MADPHPRPPPVSPWPLRILGYFLMAVGLVIGLLVLLGLVAVGGDEPGAILTFGIARPLTALAALPTVVLLILGYAIARIRLRFADDAPLVTELGWGPWVKRTGNPQADPDAEAASRHSTATGLPIPTAGAAPALIHPPPTLIEIRSPSALVIHGLGVLDPFTYLLTGIFAALALVLGYLGGFVATAPDLRHGLCIGAAIMVMTGAVMVVIAHASRQGRWHRVILHTVLRAGDAHTCDGKPGRLILETKTLYGGDDHGQRYVILWFHPADAPPAHAIMLHRQYASRAMPAELDAWLANRHDGYRIGTRF